MLSVLDDHLAVDDCGVAAVALDDESSAAMGQIVHIFGMAGGESFIVDDVEVAVLALSDLSSLAEAHQLGGLRCQLTNGIGKGEHPSLTSQLAE